MSFFIRIVHLDILRVWRRARETCFVEGAYGTQDLFYAGTEAAYTRQTIVLRDQCAGWSVSLGKCAREDEPGEHFSHVRLLPMAQVGPRRLRDKRFAHCLGVTEDNGVPESAISVTVKPFLHTFLWVRVTMSDMP